MKYASISVYRFRHRWVHTDKRTNPVPNIDAARKKLLRALTRRSLTKAEATHKLAEWGAAPSDATAILTDFLRAGYLDDHRFAENYTTARLAHGFGWNRIRQELTRRGVPPALIDEVQPKRLNDTSESEPSGELLQATAEKEWRKLGNMQPEVRRRRWLGRMQRRGFALSRILTVLRALERQENTTDVRRHNEKTGRDLESLVGDE